MKASRIPVETIDAILAHLNPLARSGASDAAKHYMLSDFLMEGIVDHRVEALNKLAKIYNTISDPI